MKAKEKLIAAFLVLVFAPAVIALARVWSSVDYYSHGFLVPLVAYWIARRDGKTRLRAPDERTPAGAAVIGLALALYAAGLAAGVAGVQGLGLIVAVAGGALYLLGPAGLRSLAFPIAFLVFMLPLPNAWLTPVILDLQLLVSSAAVALLHAFDATVAREGNVVLLAGGDSLFVEEACSGITSIVTLIPLAVMLAYFTQRTLWRRLVLVAAVAPAAMVANLLRVVFTVIVAQNLGAERATNNALHESAGLFTFVLACLALIGLGALLRGPRAQAA
ncbi:MAG: exosortase/archaeosortase family protein [Planctomycetota bacterium]|jgi:exosortase